MSLTKTTTSWKRDGERFRQLCKELRESTYYLCNSCATLTFDKLKTEEVYEAVDDGDPTACAEYARVTRYGWLVHPTWADFERSVSEGCHLCKLMFHVLNFKHDVEQSIEERGPASLDSDAPFRDHDFRYAFDGPFDAQFCVKSGVFHKTRATVEPFVKRDFPLEINVPESIGGREIEPDPCSERSLTFIRNCLSHCSSSHACCPPNLDEVLPTRVIELLDRNDDNFKCDLRLLETKGASGRYIALSHCWGQIERDNNKRLYTCNSQNYDTLLTGFHSSKLAQNFYDAVKVTRKLGVRYLWIDSLCIIQDSQEDWLRESVTMAKVYSRSYATIAAISAASTDEGFLNLREFNLYAETKVCAAPGAPGHFFHVRWPPIDEGADVLSARAWTLQEFLLPPRVVQFSSTMITFVCESCKVPESRAEGPLLELSSTHEDDVAESKGAARRFLDEDLRRALLAPGDADWTTDGSDSESLELEALDRDERDCGNTFTSKQRRKLTQPLFCKGEDVIQNAALSIRRWCNVVEEYTDRSISFEADRLPAISAIAQVVQQYTKSDYLAGLWADDLGHQLAWEPFSTSMAEETSTYVAPSWSWASVSGQVDFPSTDDGETIHKAELLKSDICNLGDSKFGPVTKGVICLRGFMLRITRDETAAEKPLFPPCEKFRMRFDLRIAPTASEFWCFNLLRFPRTDDWYEPLFQVHGLVLEEVQDQMYTFDGRRLRVFRRVGAYEAGLSVPLPGSVKTDVALV